MNCTVCSKEFRQNEKAYATVAGYIDRYSTEDGENLGFFACDIEPWLTVLCENCGLKVHDLIAKLQTQEA